ncbi:hypothetical protein [Lyngbya aestuarii]|uniref:hypothetical protein n=1 Tax=Lyngbya aestuarii TaxID=118322 RepID=UPI00403DD1C2
MSQDVSTKKGAREHLNVPSSIKPWSAESDADTLMDDLFSDIDRVLEGGSTLPTELVKPEYVALKSIVIPKITRPPAVIPPQELSQRPSNQPRESALAKPLETAIQDTASSDQTKRSAWSVEKFLLGTGFIAVVVAIALLLLTKQGKLTWSWLLNLVNSSSSLENRQLSASDHQFVEYMQRSLEIIDSKRQTNQATKTAVVSGTNPDSQQALASANSPVALKQAPTVLERVYYPVYQPQRPSAPRIPSAVARPPAPAPSVVARPPAPAPSAVVARPPAPAPSVAARPPAPAPSVAAKPPVPAPSVVVQPPPAQTAPQEVTPAPEVVENSPTQPSPTPIAKHTLVGLVELGANSAALFDLDGITQRVYVGEAIGASGWTLVSVANDEAVIRRNGEVRSIYAGQQF